ncbi:MAG: hypothetical protein H5U19_08035 [Rhodobacteraceae bacterium]|jgi:hypothetical protein|nr:hypothetical protein [Paracoccaceae bacterium]
MKTERGFSDMRRALRQIAVRGACLDCPQCSGACWHALELRLLPEAILKDKGASA